METRQDLNSQPEAVKFVAGQVAENTKESCMAWVAGGERAAGKDRAALVKSLRWRPGDKLTIAFLDGDPGVQERVRQMALRWTRPGLARLTFSFLKDPAKALIRISFKYVGSWSNLGTSCKGVSRNAPTMNFGWLTPESTDEELRSVVLHEFGHALGLIHEHQNPTGGIPWDKEAVYRDLSGPPNNWRREDIDSNLFEPYSRRETNYTKTDMASIMMYPVKKSWTLNGFSVGLNRDLSPTDEKFIHQQYP
ncbi:zinc metalloprotease [Pyxidicoccus xibeiensis]|uniref:hypothetical protein n=1 Tax=Pyxidicoccus xibeiensis TaxID=2906759 RepID=UPI0020A7D7C8|nr:hypothetical protein [Pyxidicoccus xibeiensis]MCP3143123.1 hypothetical protein [Pyxidicoccus xibeiensis]